MTPLLGSSEVAGKGREGIKDLLLARRLLLHRGGGRLRANDLARPVPHGKFDVNKLFAGLLSLLWSDGEMRADMNRSECAMAVSHFAGKLNGLQLKG
jgi:hypothetical protein